MHKHERVSKLHADNLQKDDVKAAAVAKLAKAGLEPRPVVAAAATTNDAWNSTEYRDRARERRKAYGGPAKISLPLKKPGAAGAAGKTAATETERTPAVGAPQASKGAALLGKMGWASGAGLGAQGTGSTAPIATDMYVEGVGLGAQGGRVGDAAAEAERNTKNSYTEFLERTKDKAKERFEQLS